MKIEYLPSPDLYNVGRTIETEKGDMKIETDFMLRAIKIKNTIDKAINIKKCIFELNSESENQKKIIYSAKILEQRAITLIPLIDRLMVPKTGYREILRKGNVGQMFGTEYFWDMNQFTGSAALKPNQETGFTYEHFRITSLKSIDELKITIVYEINSRIEKTTITIPIVKYQNLNDYIFPLKGAWIVIGNWDDPYDHREAHGQEFAIDLVQLDDLRYFQDKERPLNEYSCYGKPIFAAADGKVVECHDGIPEAPTSCSDLHKTKILELLQNHGYAAIAAGNYVIIEHKGGEFSFYAHMKPDSVNVKPGDKVEQGQVIGNVGNSGHSTGPHLHFHLMDKPCILTGRGLPCFFKNLTDVWGQSVNIIAQNYLVIHTT